MVVIFYALLVPPRITCEFHLIRRRRHVREPGNLVRARDILPGNGIPRLKFESKDSRHVEAERFPRPRQSWRLGGVASFRGKTLRYTLIRSERTDSKLAELQCTTVSHAGEDTGNNYS